MRGGWAGLVIAFALLLVAPGDADACTVAPMSQRRLDRQADLIFTGTAVRVEHPGFALRTDELVTWTFVVDGWEKGSRGERLEVASSLSGSSCGFEFELGHRYRVLASTEQRHLPPTTGLGSGNMELERLPVSPRPEGTFYSFVVAVPLPVLIAVPILAVAGVLFLLVIGLRWASARITARSPGGRILDESAGSPANRSSGDRPNQESPR